MRFDQSDPGCRRLRRSVLATTALATAALAAATLAGGPPRPAAAAEIDTLGVFGDSYSALNRKAFPNWAEQFRDEGTVDTLVGFARSGATASTVGTNHFKKQYNAFNATDPTFGAGDLTVVYFGYNDIDQTSIDLAKSQADYATYVNRVIGKGATDDGASALTHTEDSRRAGPAVWSGHGSVRVSRGVGR
jgi:phospholipase/lecithinase/hemolysin